MRLITLAAWAALCVSPAFAHGDHLTGAVADRNQRFGLGRPIPAVQDHHVTVIERIRLEAHDGLSSGRFRFRALDHP